MRFCHIIFLTLVTFVTSNNNTSAANHLDVHAAALTSSSVAEIQGGVPTNRFLRIHNEDDEERAFDLKSILKVDKISNYLNKRQLAKILKKNNEDIDSVFAKLQLNVAGEKIFENPNFLTWAKYVGDYNVKHPDKAVSMLPRLLEQYGHTNLAKMLEAAKKVESTQRAATKLQSEQMKIWKNADLSIDELFKIYKLDHDSNPIANPVINFLGRYSDEFFRNKKTALLDTLRTYYSDSTLSQLLIAARKVSSTKDTARKLEDQQLRDFDQLSYFV